MTREGVDFVVAVLFAMLVYDDARKRDWGQKRFASKPLLWGLSVFLLWIVVLPLYLMRRRKSSVLASMS